MFDYYDYLRVEIEEANEEAKLAYFEFHLDDETEIETEVEIETEIDKEIIFTLENF
jgi:hypothetical protein